MYGINEISEINDGRINEYDFKIEPVSVILRL